MKETQRTFLLYGDHTSCKLVLKELAQFKAVIVLSKFSNREIWNVYGNNKCAVIWMGEQTIANNKYFTRPIFSNQRKAKAISIFVGEKYPGCKDVIDPIERDESISKQFTAIAAKYNIDVGDYVAKDKPMDLLNPTDTRNCPMCGIVEHRGNVKEVMILYETEKFIVIPALGSLVPGYVMVVPKAHRVFSIAHLNHEERLEMLAIVQTMKAILGPLYGDKFVMFERSGEGKYLPANSVVHCHLHLIPTSTLDLNKALDKSGLIFNPIESFDEMDNFKDLSYLLCADQNENWCISATPDSYIPRQYVRQLVAESLDLEPARYDWRKFHFLDIVKTTVSEVAAFLNGKFDVLPGHVQIATTELLQLHASGALD